MQKLLDKKDGTWYFKIELAEMREGGDDMEINTMKLKGKIRENQMSIGIDSSTLFRKLSSGGDSFSIKQVHQAVSTLNLSREEAIDIFLPQDSRKCEK